MAEKFSVDGTGGNMVWHRWKYGDGTGGNMVWHRWKYGGVVTIVSAKSKSLDLGL